MFVACSPLIIAQLLALGMWGALFSSLNDGLGKSFNLLSVTKISHMQKVRIDNSVQSTLVVYVCNLNIVISHSTQVASYFLSRLHFRNAQLCFSFRAYSAM